MSASFFDMLRDEGRPAEAFEAAESCSGWHIVRPSYFVDNPPPMRSPLSMGWRKLDALTLGLRWGEMWVVTGDTGAGKTTLAADFARRAAVQGKRAGYGVLYVSLESNVRDILAKQVSQHSGLSLDVMSDAQRAGYVMDLDRLPMRYLLHNGSLCSDAVVELIRYVATMQRVKVVVVDHLAYTIESGANDERFAIDRAVRQYAACSRETDTFLLLIAHPKATQTDDAVLDMSSLKGSAAIKQEAAGVLGVRRMRTRTREDAAVAVHADFSSTTIGVLKVRAQGGREGSVTMTFHVPSSRFVDDECELATLAADARFHDRDEAETQAALVEPPPDPEQRRADLWD